MAKETKSMLNQFLELVEQIPADIQAALLKNATDEDEKNIITAITPILENQFKELATAVREANLKATLQQQQETETFLRISSGLTVAKNLRLALPSIGSLVGKFGITQIIMTIKKIIRKLFPNIPNWLDAILEIIDELFNNELAGNSMSTKNMLSQAEQNFLKESRLLVLLEKARENGAVSADEDDE